MAFLMLDGAEPAAVARAVALGADAGVTTNPRLLAATGRPRPEALEALLDAARRAGVSGPVFAQVEGADAPARAADADALLAASRGALALKVPATPRDLPLVRRLVRVGVEVAVTAVYTPAQALAAAAAGATWVIPYVSRLGVHALAAQGPLARMRAVIDALDADTRLLGASLHDPADVPVAILRGCHALTLPIAVIEALAADERTEEALARFREEQG